MKGRVLVVAGSDSGGGAGIQADIKTITALGAYAATAITALTAQNTEAVLGILNVAPDFVRRQMAAVLDDIGADCVKTGMLVDGAVIEAVASTLEERRSGVPLVVDPVLVSSSGTRLLDLRAIDVLKRRLIAGASVVTPNAPEAETLTGMSVASLDDMRRAADRLLDARRQGGRCDRRPHRRRRRPRSRRRRWAKASCSRRRASRRARRTARDAPWRRQSPRRSRKGSRSGPRSSAPTPSSSARSRRRPVWGAATGR